MLAFKVAKMPQIPAQTRLILRTFANAKTESSKAPITPRSVDYNAWYNDVLYAADMVDQSPVRGCTVLKPWAMSIWELLRDELDNNIKEIGASNAYFPLFIPQSFMAKEAEHVEGFAKECAVVSHYRLTVDPENPKKLIPDPTAKLEEPLIVRPTSETVIWSMFHRWIKSHRDLPLKINQWANVVRWEMRTRPFLRTSEFLWQEGHTAHANADCALSTVSDALTIYHDVCQNFMAIPTVKGVKSPSERFAGAVNTFTIEALMQNGWALQAGTSHYLGENFARAFDVQYMTEDEGQRRLVHATSWGVSTRLIGALIMTHSDDKGLVLPPRIAPVQVVIVPLPLSTKNTDPEMGEKIKAVVKKMETALKKAGVRVKVDDRDYIRPGAKYFHWEQRGVPVRIDVGPKDVQANNTAISLRHTGAKSTMSFQDINVWVSELQNLLESVQSDLLLTAQNRLASHTHRLNSYEEMKQMLKSEAASDDSTTAKDGTTTGFYLVPWKCDAKNEEAIKQETKATIRCYPLAENTTPPAVGIKCFYSGEQATHMAIFARAF